VSEIGFINFEASNYALRSDIPLRNKGFGIKFIGVALDPKTVGGK